MKVIVSFTTIPDRINNIKKTLDSMEKQSVRPDTIYLNLPNVCRRQKHKPYVIPDFLEENRNVIIVKTDYDYGSSMKLLPALNRVSDPDTIIITIDDDHEYNEQFIATLLEYEKKFPDCALGFNGWNIKSLIENNKYDFIDETVKEPVQADVLEGYRGVLYKKRFFDKTIFDYHGFPEAAFRVDDVWISAHLAKNGVVRLVLPGIYSKEYELPRGLHKKLSFKLLNKKMAIEFRKRNYW
ncbi:MAG: hypothetical protein JSV25_04970 [Spirochaetota bacterium]|nr:MAG: hypothetical protein JSV25_04970 [Spirochaetota bacterium]